MSTTNSLSNSKAALLTITFGALMVAGFPFDIEGARNLAQLAVWALYLPLHLLSLSDRMRSESYAKHKGSPKAPAILRALNRTVTWATLALLGWYGAWVTAGAWVFVIISGASYRAYVAEQDQKGSQA